ncbi:MAG: FAD-dependent oxidoreductase [Methanobacteriota archaeon]
MPTGHIKTTPPWLDTVPDKLRFPALHDQIKADVVVIGGGIAGVMTAWCLAERDLSVALLEKGHVAMGATGFTTAFLTRGTGHVLFRDREKPRHRFPARGLCRNEGGATISAPRCQGRGHKV